MYAAGMSSDSIPGSPARSTDTRVVGNVNKSFDRDSKSVVHDVDASVEGTTPTPPAVPAFVTWDGPNDPQNPQNWSPVYKWWLTFIIAFQALTV